MDYDEGYGLHIKGKGSQGRVFSKKMQCIILVLNTLLCLMSVSGIGNSPGEAIVQAINRDRERVAQYNRFPILEGNASFVF